MRFRPRKDTGSGSALTESTPVPPTPAELEWWAEARRPLRRRTMAIQGTVFSALAGANLLLTDTAGFLDGGWLSEVPIAVGLVVGGTWLSWRLLSTQCDLATSSASGSGTNCSIQRTSADAAVFRPSESVGILIVWCNR